MTNILTLSLAILATACIRSSPSTGESGSTGETGSPDTQDTGPFSTELSCNSDWTTAPADLPQPNDYGADGTYVYRIVQIPSDDFDELYATVFFPSDPQQKLYAAGAPVVVAVVPALEIQYDLVAQLSSDYGVIEVQPLYPGWSYDGIGTSGHSDLDGWGIAAALRDTIRFAAGDLDSVDGLSIGQLVGMDVCNRPLTVLGASSGGAAVARALDWFSDDLKNLVGGMATHESPSMHQFIIYDAGALWMDPNEATDGDGNGFTWDDGRNRTYQPGACDRETCNMDYSDLRRSTDVSLGEIYSMFGAIPEQEVYYLDHNGNCVLDYVQGTGTLDVDGNGYLDDDEDYVFCPHWDDKADNDMDRRFYTPEVLQAAIDNSQLDPGDWPSYLATLDESTEFWQSRNMLSHVSAIAAAYPSSFRAVVEYTEEDHGVAQPTHPHVYYLYEALREDGVTVRYNGTDDMLDCVVPADKLSGWAGARQVGEYIAEEDLADYALPETVFNAMARAVGTTALIWDLWGPFDLCPAQQ